MTYPDSFYYEEKQENVLYSHKQQGTLDVNRLVKGKAPWKSVKYSVEQKQKTLVLADWTAEHLSYDRIEQVLNQVMQLIDEGFIVHRMYFSRLLPLTKENIDVLRKKSSRVLLRWNYSKEHTFINRALHLTSDKWMLVDDYWLDTLIESDEQRPTKRKIHVFAWLRNEHSGLLHYLKNTDPEVAEIVLDEFTTKAISTYKKLKNHFPNATCIHKFKHLVVDEQILEQLFEEGSYTLDEGITFTLDDLSDIESIKVKNITQDQLNQLLQLTPNATKLKFINCNNLSGIFNNEIKLEKLRSLKITTKTLSLQWLESLLSKSSIINNLEIETKEQVLDDFTELLSIEQLENIEFTVSQINSKQLECLLQRKNSIKKLSLNSCTHLLEVLTKPLELNELEILNMNHCTCTVEFIESLLKHAPKIRKLFFNHHANLNSSFSGDLNLGNLRELSIYHAHITNECLSSLLKKATGLEYLSLDQWQDEEAILPSSLSLTCLQTINLHGSTISAVNLYTLLNSTQKIRTLFLSHCENISGVFNNNLNLEKLTTIYLDSTPIIEQDLVSLLNQASTLDELKLDKCPNLVNTLQGLNKIEGLTDLSLRESNISTQCLQSLLIQTANINQLDLSHCGNISGTFTELLSLPYLEELDVSGSSISEDNLLHLLANSKHLKQLKLADWTMGSFNFIKALQLEQLEQIDLNSTHINSQNLVDLLLQSKKIQRLELRNCPNLTSPFNSSFKLEHLQELYLSKSTITTDNLKALLRASSNITELFLDRCPNIVFDEELIALIKAQKLKLYIRPREFDYEHIMSQDEASAENYLDADTAEQADIKYNMRRIFFPLSDHSQSVEPYQYRCSVYNNSSVNPEVCDIHNAFQLTNEADLNLIKPSKIQFIDTQQDLLDIGKQQAKASQDLYYASQEISLTTSWQAIASFSPNEVLSHCHITPKDAQVEIKYSQRDNLYYIKSDRHQRIKLNFLLQAKAPSQPAVAKEILQLKDKIAAYGVGACNAPKKELSSGKDYFRTIVQQKKGACRHRAFIFKTLMQEQHPEVPVRYIGNDCHAFVEVQIEGQWLTYDLGGYPVNLSIDESANPNLSENASRITETELHPDADQAEYSDTALEKRYQQQLATWNKVGSCWKSVSEYCLQAVQWGINSSQLVEMDCAEDVHALQLSLQAHCQQTQRPCFYIDSPEDLVCSAPFVERHGKHGVLKPGPGGPLYTFLQAHQNAKPPPVLIINYDNFDADDIVRFNSILDKAPRADGTALPKGTKVIGLMNVNQPGCYQGADFYSRFDLVERNPFTSNQLNQHCESKSSLTVTKKQAQEPVVSINLFHSPDWKELLLGHWQIEGDSLRFVEGELIKALTTGLPIELQNAPWDQAAFQNFWKQALLHKHIVYEGLNIVVPETLQLYQSSGYDWSALSKDVTIDTQLQAQAEVLNSGSLSTFFTRYQCIDNQLITGPGIIEECAGQDLAINLTRDLSEDEWAKLLSSCQQHQVRLSIHCAPGVTVPEFVTNEFTAQPIIRQDWDNTLSLGTQVLVSSDIDCTLHQLRQTDSDYQIMDVSECDSNDLLLNTQAAIDKTSAQFSFSQTKQVLLTALEKGQKVLLKGVFSQELVDALAPIVLARQTDPNAKGQLVLLSSSDCFNYLDAATHQVSSAEKQTVLGPNQLPEKLVEEEPLSKLNTRARFLQRNPTTTNSDDAWKGLLGLAGGVHLTDFNGSDSTAISAAFTEQRLQDVNRILADEPYVFLTGLTGVGKTSFVERYLKTPTSTLYMDESHIIQWALDNTDQRKILFIDEANLSPSQWSVFEGLFDQPPGLLIEGTYYPLTAEHKVVFAGNPVNYGDARRLAPFFARHGNALVFEPLPQEFIFEEIIKPVFANSSLAEHAAAISRPLLAMYRYVCESSQDRVLISPREVQMMALFVLSYAHKHPQLTQQQLVSAAENYAYQIGRNLVSEKDLIVVDQEFSPKEALLAGPVKQPAELAEFLVTESRTAIVQQLDDMLDLRELKQIKFKEHNEHLLYGGIGGLVLEGEPGTGKSELVLAALRAHGYQEVHDYTLGSNKSIPNKPFYRMPVSMQPEEKKQLLIKAFHEGAVVVIDEINSSPMMERLLNDLLMGKSPDKQRPDKPGFLIIGTQNPASMGGRHEASAALSRRLITTTVPPYTESETKDILLRKGVESARATLLTKAYMANRERARKEHLIPAPTFRDLNKLADQVIKTQLVQDLLDRIEDLRRYGVKLAKQVDVDTQSKGQQAIELAQNLKDLVCKSISSSDELERSKVKQEFADKLAEAHGMMQHHRKKYKVILANIALAATGIGLLVMIGKKIITGRGLFFSETKRQKLAKDIEQSLNQSESQNTEASVSPPRKN